MNTTVINQEVTVTSVYFRPGRNLKGYPKRMQYQGREYTFVESGLRYLAKKGQQLVEMFAMTDGTRQFLIKFSPESHSWTLVGMREAQYVA